MTNDVYKRLSALFEMLGSDLDDNSTDKAELMAYVSGIELIRSSYDDIERGINVYTASGLALSLFCELFAIDGSLSDDEKREAIVKGLSMPFGTFFSNELKDATDEFEHLLYWVNTPFYYEVSFDAKTEGDIVKLAKMRNELIPSCSLIYVDIFCADFDFWDNSYFLFADYDNLKISFDMLDQFNN